MAYFYINILRKNLELYNKHELKFKKYTNRSTRYGNYNYAKN